MRLTVLNNFIIAFIFLIADIALYAQSFAVIGDAGRITSGSKSVRNSILQAGVRTLVLPGDNLYSGTYENVWKSWSDFDFSVVAIGNHNNGYQNEINFFDMPGEFYSKEYDGGLRFLVLNSDNTLNVDRQMKWLERELQKEASITFLVWHHPSYNLGAHSWDGKLKFQTAVRSLIRQYSSKISAVLLGHDHIAAFYCADNIPLILSGAVQETTQPVTRNYKAENGVNISTKWVFPQSTPTWVRLDVDTENKSVVVKYIRASDNKVMFKSKLDEENKISICRS